MAKFRKNHNRAESSATGGMVTKVGIFGLILAALFWGFNQFMGDTVENATEIITGNPPKTGQGSGPGSPGIPTVPGNMLPTSTTGQIINHEFYSLSYDEEHEQAEWVAYELTKESLIVPNVKRTGNFRPDPKVRKASASDRDYRGSGYDRGHMAPAGDMAFSKEAMSQTFYMSNMSPQIRNFNGGIWRELEENVRNWAKYAVTIDEVEEVTGIDFFHELLDDVTEEQLESSFDIDKWKFDNKTFRVRKDKWNKRR